MQTTRSLHIARLIPSPWARAARARWMLLALLVGGSAVAREDAAPAPGPRAPTERILLRARSGHAERARSLLNEAEATFGLREVTEYESGCRLVERPRDVSLDELQARYGAELEISPNRAYRVARAVNDPLYSSDQAAVLRAIHVPEAWDFFPGQAPGSDQIVVAVVDTGVDDHNVDLDPSRMVHPGATASPPDLGADEGDPPDGPGDRNGHGTASAGIIAARGDNGAGIAGVAWGSRVLSLKCFDAAGESDDDRLIRCYQHLTNLKRKGKVNVRVVNDGWGGLPSSPCLMQAIAAAGDAGILSVFAAGNGAPGRDLDQTPEYPAAAGLPSTVSVASATLDGVLADDSNFGATTVDLAAPGRDITSLGLCPAGEAPCRELVHVSGTSFAAPFVSGAAALLFAQDPTRTPEQVKRLLTANVTPYPVLQGEVRSGGLLNVAAALANVAPAAPDAPPADALAPSSGLPFADGTYAVDVAEFPGPAQKSPPIRPDAGFLFVRTVDGVQEERWLLLGWNGHAFARPPLHAMGMSVRPAALRYPAPGEALAVVTDLPSWTAFARSRFAPGRDAADGPATYAKVAKRVVRGPGPLAPPFDYPAYLDPPPPARAAIAQIEPARPPTVSAYIPTADKFETIGYVHALGDGNGQSREHWVMFGGASAASSVVVGSIGDAFGAPDFASLMNQRPWQEGSTLVLGSVRYYPFVAE